MEDEPKPFEIAGEKAKGGSVAQVEERNGKKSRFRGHFLDQMTGGDTVHYGYDGVTTFKDRMTPENATWDWTIAGGTGKFTGLKGQGTCKGNWATGSYKWSCSGAYQLK